MRAFTNPTARKLALAGSVAAVGLLLSACGSDSDSMSGMEHGGKTSASPSSPASASASFNDADVAFAQAMIPHHQQALEMAKLADGRAEDAEVQKIVAAIEKAQDPEIATMKSWLKGWGKPESAAHGGHDMAGMMTEQDMKDLEALKGKPFDRKFAELMIAHHEGAVEMARTELKDGRDEKAKKLAADVVRTQSAEIAELRKILDRL
ncbi:DUF305 domain-containing protein [Streptomyces sp. NPDC003035]|uniref:DUF305 domain-containing protein n=1 Tax=Streptomyces sp. NPDC003035 TaxID=3364676 RepID=UPI0036A75AA1